MTITDQLFEAFLQCPTKCFLRAKGEAPTGNVYSEWVRGQFEAYRSAIATRLTERVSAIELPSGLLDLANSISTDWRCALGVRARSINLESHIHAVERTPLQSADSTVQWVPIRFVRANRPTRAGHRRGRNGFLRGAGAQGHRADTGRGRMCSPGSCAVRSSGRILRRTTGLPTSWDHTKQRNSWSRNTRASAAR